MWKPLSLLTAPNFEKYKAVELEVTKTLLDHMQHIDNPKTRPICNAYSSADFPDIHAGITLVKLGYSFLKGEEATLEDLTDAKLWEYGTATQILLDLHWDTLHQLNILDVYPGFSPLGPALHFESGMTVTEYEPDLAARQSRDKINGIIKELDKTHKGVFVFPYTIDSMPSNVFDAVFCTSVVHLTKDQLESLKHLAAKVTQGGILFVTMLFNAKTKEHIDAITNSGFAVLGTPDYTDAEGKLFRCAWIKK